MGEAAADILDGTVCQVCGVWNDDLIAHCEHEAPGGGIVEKEWDPPGFPWTCPVCREEPGA